MPIGGHRLTTSRTSPRRRSRQALRLGLEALEDRRLLTTILVDTLTDEVVANDTTSLREAIALAADADHAGPDSISFAPDLAGTIDLALGQLVLSDATGDVAIEATTGVTTINAGGQSRVLVVQPGTTATLTGLTLTGGQSLTGGGISSLGTLTLIDSTVSGNTASASGGGINSIGTVSLTGSTVSDNSAGVNGGGIFSDAFFYDMLTLTDSTISGNSAAVNGGGIFNLGTTIISNSLISQNKAGQDGGGIFNSSGSVTVSGVHFAHNVASRNGGALYINAGTASIIDSIFSGNKTKKKTGLGTSIFCVVDGSFNIDDETVISQNGVPIFKEL